MELVQFYILGVHAKREVLQVQVSRGGALRLNQVSQFVGGFHTMRMVILLLLFFGFTLGGEGIALTGDRQGRIYCRVGCLDNTSWSELSASRK